MRSSFASKAEGLVYGDREKTYNDPNKNFRNIAAVWSSITGYDITPKQVALMMTGLKLVREGNAHQDDNLIDAHGYLMCLERIINEDLDGDSSSFTGYTATFEQEVTQWGNHPDADSFGMHGEPRQDTPAQNWAMHDRQPPKSPEVAKPIQTRRRPPIDPHDHRDALDMG